MRIIKPGILPEYKCFFTCRCCGCEFEAEIEECERRMGEYNSTDYLFRCPTCERYCSTAATVINQKIIGRR